MPNAMPTIDPITVLILFLEEGTVLIVERLSRELLALYRADGEARSTHPRLPTSIGLLLMELKTYRLSYRSSV